MLNGRRVGVKLCTAIRIRPITQLIAVKAKPGAKIRSAPARGLDAEPRTAERVGTPVKGAATAIALKRLLVPIDFSECSLHALNYARVLGEALKASIILLHVVEPGGFGPGMVGLSPSLQEANQTRVQGSRDRLVALGDKHLGHRLAVEALVRVGHAHSEISDTAKAMGADVIVLGTHGLTASGQTSLGGTAERVLRHTTCPVLAVRFTAPN